MYVSHETEEQTHRRLLKVIAAAEMRIYEGTFAFEEMPRKKEEPPAINSKALAIVGDNEVWSQLVPSADAEAELFSVFSFHFAANLDNSGFVGWLASLLKREIGTGVFVVCGQNSQRGGIFDYWGCPVSEAEAVLDIVNRLRQQSTE